jgi:hypothetical protein
MSEHVPRSDYPWWVKLSMWGVSGRSGLWVFFALSVAAAVSCVVYGFFLDPRFFFGVAFLFSALMYLLSIRWVDRHGSWDEDTSSINSDEW